MPIGASLHIGLNAVDPKHYSGWAERVNATMKTLRYDQISDVKGPKAACRAPVLGSLTKARSR